MDIWPRLFGSSSYSRGGGSRPALRGAASYAVSTWIFLRLLGLVYLFAFWSLAQQIQGLIGHAGILPAADYMNDARAWADAGGVGLDRYRLLPTLCWFSASDGFLQSLTIAGVVLSLAQVAGLLSPLVLPALWLLYLSVTVVAGDFLSFQWDALLLEAGLVAVAVTPFRWRHRWRDRINPPAAGRCLLWWLLFRLMFASGFVKLASGDPAWRDLTALMFHYETQPLPTPLAWYVAQLPAWCHQLSTAGVFAIELAVPWLIAARVRLRRLAVIPLLGLQLLIALTGNYAFFNLLAVALCITLLDDDVFGVPAADTFARRPSYSAGVQRAIAFVLAVLIVPVSLLVFVQQLRVARVSAMQPVLDFVDPLRSVNNYGLFAIMTTTRPDIVIEGSLDGVAWKTYEFRYKPGALTRRPGWVAPFQPRLDWQMWFAALGRFEEEGWYRQFANRLLEGSPSVTRLLAGNPFPDAPPRFLRSTLYRYRFAPAGQNAWWVRERIGDYAPVMSLGDQRR